jgi:predicted RNase H-like nuclease (RuvC/YqgF family)
MGIHAKRRLADIVRDIMVLNESIKESHLLIARSEKIINDRNQKIEQIERDRKRGKVRAYHANECMYQRDIGVREREIASHNLMLKTYNNRRRALLKELAAYEDMSGIVYREYYRLGKTCAEA